MHGKVTSPTPDAEFFESFFKRLEASTDHGVFDLIFNQAVNGTGHINVLPVAKQGRNLLMRKLRNLQHIDVGAAVYGLIENEVEDAVIGRGFKSLEDAFEKLGVRGWRGDLAMQYSTDALFDLYGAVKGGL